MTAMLGAVGRRFDPALVPTPAYVLDTGLMRDNLAVLARVRERAGCRILMALKCFAMHRVFPLISPVLDGVCASSPHEARLGREYFGPEGNTAEVHAFAAGYSEQDIRDLAATCDHIVFNSLGQLRRFSPLVKDLSAQSGRTIDMGLRINPEHSEGTTPLYDPCAPGSRLGVKAGHMDPEALAGVSGLHWHNLCEQNADCLQRTIAAVEERFGSYIPGMRWVNFGGGHHITRPDYDLDLLVRLVRDFQEKWGVTVYLEPGEAIALNAGYLVSTVLDVVEQGPGGDDGVHTVIMDASVPCHMPDVIEMPYRPHILGSGLAGEKAWTCRIGGLSCLAGDVAGEYSFDKPLEVGDRLVFTDMAIYTMVKTNTFNGIQLPSIMLYDPEIRELELVREFGYQDFASRLS